MNYDSGPMPLDGSRRKKVVFDLSINLGHILTFIGFMGTGSVAYFDLRERISVNEQKTVAIAAEVAAEKIRISETLSTMREDVREVRRGVHDLLQRKEKP